MNSKLGQCEIAVYNEAISDIEIGNPFLEALPPIDVVFSRLKNNFRVQQFSDRLKNASDYEKRVHLYELEFFLSPFSVYERTLEMVLGALKGRYAKKNPLDSEVRRSIIKKVYSREYVDDITHFAGKFSEPSITIIGTPGIGKTTVVNTILGCLPQLIVHDDYYGFQMENHAQIVYLKIDAPVDGKCITLCKDIFLAIDDVLKRNSMDAISYYNKYANTSKTSIDMLHQLNILVDQLGIGIIAIDEIQRIVALDNEKEEIVNFIMNFSNISQIPIILLGTNDAEELFKKKFFMARRGASKKITMLPFKQNNKDWDFMVTQMWKMQLIDPIEPLTDDIKLALYKYSGGITAVLLLLFKFSQRNALKEKKMLNVDMIIKTANTDLKQLTTIILNKENYTTSRYTDLIYEANNRWDKEKQEAEETKSSLMEECMKNSGYENQLIFEIAKRIVEDKIFDKTETQIKKIVTETYNNHPLLDKASIYKMVIKKMFSMEEEIKTEKESNNIEKTKPKKIKANNKLMSKIIEEVEGCRAPLNDFQ